MPTPPQRNPYPENLEAAKGGAFEQVHRLHGSGDPNLLFKGAPKTLTPWPSAGKTKAQPRGYDQNLVNVALKAPEQHMTEMDPRHLHATQPWVTKEGVDYYMTDEYKKTGRTFADQGNAGNRFPVVYRDTQGRNKLLSGHHRATAALHMGGQFHALLVQELSE
jgi:hypothetical protein